MSCQDISSNGGFKKRGNWTSCLNGLLFVCIFVCRAHSRFQWDLYHEKKVHYSHSDISLCLWINVSLNWSVTFSSLSCLIRWSWTWYMHRRKPDAHWRAENDIYLFGKGGMLPDIRQDFQPVAFCFSSRVESFNWMRWSGRSQRSSFTDSRTSRLNTEGICISNRFSRCIFYLRSPAKPKSSGWVLI